MSEMLTREQLQDAAKCYIAGNCNVCTNSKTCCGSGMKNQVTLLAKTVLYWQGKAERQAAALEQAREVLADWLVARTDEGKAKKRAAIKAIEGVQGE